MEWLGHARVSFTHHEKTVPVTFHSGEETSLSDLVKSTTPPCKLNPLLFNGHLQTAWTAVKEAGPAITYKRKIFESDDARFAGSFAVDFVRPAVKDAEEDETLPPRTTYFTESEFAALPSDDVRPLLISLHGLSGGSHEIYLRQVLAPLVAHMQTETSTSDGVDSVGGTASSKDESTHWEALVVNSRGCAMSKITTGILYNARATWDIRQIVRWCRETFPNRPLYAVGYSLGANILTNYLGEEGDKCLLQAAVIVSNPWKLEVSNLALQRSWLGLNVYSKMMGSNMKKLFERHREQVLKNGNIKEEEIMNVKYLHEFDRAIQCPTWGYPTEGAYYRDASSADAVFAIRIPSLVVHAEDDPIAVNESVPYQEIKQNPYVICCHTSMGGHLSWFENGGSRWFSKPVVAFLQKMASEMDSKTSKSNVTRVEEKTRTTSAYQNPFVFEPMRRALHLPAETS